MLGLALCLTLVAADAPAADDADVRRGVAAYAELEYRRAVDPLERALARTSLVASDRVIALATLGRARAVLREREKAIHAFALLLRLAPAYALDEDESSLIHDVFLEAKKGATGDAPRTGPDTGEGQDPAATGDATTLSEKDAAALALEQAMKEDWLKNTQSNPNAAAHAEEEKKRIILGLEMSTWAWIAAGVVGGTTLAILATQQWYEEPAPVGSLGRWRVP